MEMSTDFTVQDLYADLIKGVFRTFSFSESKWEKTLNVPDIGRTFFQDHKADKAPFSEAGVEKFRLLYNSALQDDMTIPATLITSRLANVLQKRIFVNLTFLIFYDDDTEKLRTAKKAYWLTILDKVTTFLVGKEEVAFSDLFFLHEEARKIESRIKPVAKGTYTYEIIDEPEREQRQMKKEITERIAKEVFIGDGSDEGDYDDYDYIGRKAAIAENIRALSEAKKGLCLFFLNCSITNVTSFIERFPKYSQLELQTVKTCKTYPEKDEMLQYGGDIIEYEEWSRKMENGGICPLLETGFVCSGFDIEGVKDGMEKGVSYICIGASDEYQKLKDYVDNVVLFLVVPDKIEQVIYEMETRGYFADAAKERLKSLRDSIDFMLANDGFVIRWQAGQGNRALAYYAGMIDSIISMNPLTKQLNMNFLQDYRDTIEKITSA